MTRKMILCFSLILLQHTRLPAQEQPKPVFPSTTFNKEEANSLLNNGTATLNGVVLKKKRNPDNTYLGIVVTLFPCTAYFDDWYALQKKNKKGKTMAMMSPEAYSYRIVTKASDEDGTFSFHGLKPGRYYLQTMVRQGKMKTMLNEVGTSTTVGYNVFGQAVSTYTEPIYEEFKLFYDTNDLVKTFIEVTAEGQVVNVKL
ncbi:prealbumin-like fold domain-containing protein [Taibaiella koreensis]|uniref:prealbumin-like fold domain-containing protein n=1 Tax=Taibaiella koreensis TaxID=1268548 RepID=UPI0013C37516|nr:prealbumin-like fold domain-containing protein [Taibaiella koreensis]